MTTVGVFFVIVIQLQWIKLSLHSADCSRIVFFFLVPKGSETALLKCLPFNISFIPWFVRNVFVSIFFNKATGIQQQ